MSYISARPDKILLALSGGVDSAVCAKILQEQGFDVHGLYIVFSPEHEKGLKNAEQAAKELSINLEAADCKELFDESVISPFCAAYAKGQTPNPCIICNPLVKFEALKTCADKLGIHYIASGHYARIEEVDNIYHVGKALSAARDQSYVLYRLQQDVLKRLCLPLGEFEKDDIRQMAADYGLSSANAPDSQEICFIPDNNHAKYIAQRGIKDISGCFIAPDGKNLGSHKGVSHYTVGQRKGLGLSFGEPVYIKEIRENGNILLSYGGGEFCESLTITDIISPSGGFASGEKYEVKIRSAAKPVGCTIGTTSNTHTQIIFDEPQRAAAAGQSAVLYKNELVRGGGFIV